MLYEQQNQQMAELEGKKFASQTTAATILQTKSAAAVNSSESPTPLSGMLPRPSQMPQLTDSSAGFMSFMPKQSIQPTRQSQYPSLAGAPNLKDIG